MKVGPTVLYTYFRTICTFVRVLSKVLSYESTFEGTSVRVRVHVYTCTAVQCTPLYEYKQLMEYLSCISEDILSACSSGLLYTTTHTVGFFRYSIVFYFRKYVYCTCTTTCTTYNRLDFHKQLTVHVVYCTRSPTTLFY